MSSPNSSLCPFDERRNAREMYVKFFVVHFTTIIAFCHLLSIRREKILSWRTVIYIFVPFNIIVQHLLALFLIFCAVCFLVILETYSSRSRSRMPQFARVVRFLREHLLLVLTPPKTNVARPEFRTRAEEGIEQKAKTVGRFIIQLAFMAQCIASIILYYRRKQHDADAITHYDMKVFELACGGLMVTLLTTGHEIITSTPSSTQAFPAIDRAPTHPATDRAPIHASKGTQVTGLFITSVFPQLQNHYDDFKLPPVEKSPQAYILPIYSFILLRFLYTWRIFNLCNMQLRGEEIYNWWTFKGIILFGTSLSAIQDIAWVNHSYPYHQFAVWLLKPDGMLMKGWMWFSFCVRLFDFAFPAVTVLAVGYGYHQAFSQVAGFRALGEDVACPQAWKDPAGDYLWWLA